MWILVILSTIYGTDEVKITHYDLYQNETKCRIEQAVLEATFENQEVAVCMENKK